ncbi:MAG: hypothetical protein KZQ89_01595 [Candidatus Thiodiazotropha sp. (ex Lucinoma kastoroae)]|nr:hypothetical protein [Candidatus Thiodiazotropha sp. (ex Lucinoma kastoroae)]
MTESLQSIKKGLLSHFFPTLFRNPNQSSGEEATQTDDAEVIKTNINDPYLGESVPEIEMLQGVREEIHRLKRMRNSELDKAEHLVKRLKDLEKERIDILTQSKVEEDKELLKSAEIMLKEIDQLERDRKDCVGIAEQLAKQADTLIPKVEDLERASLIQLGKYLEDRMSALVDHYHTTAPEVAETVLQIRAVQRVMIHYGTGNSNGFHGEIHLPNIVAFDQKSRVPLMEGESQVFSNTAGELSETIKKKLFELGYRYGIKYN